MTEAEWLACTDATTMVNSVWRNVIDRKLRLCDRKLRLFGCACLRRIWHLVADRRGQEAVQVAERYADGDATDAELEAHFLLAWRAERLAGKTGGKAANRWAYDGAKSACARMARSAALWGSHKAACAVGRDAIGGRESPAKAKEWSRERGSQAELFRCIFGNPFRPVTLDPSWLRWNDGAVVKIARAIYVERRFEDLPISTVTVSPGLVYYLPGAES